jgi:hypothetical protein
VFGCSLRAICITLLVVLLTACSEKKASDLAFNVDFACASDRELADQLELRLVSGGCEGEEIVYEASLGKGDTAPAGNGIAPGTYGLSAIALREGETLASACLELTLPAAEAPTLHLRSPDCEEPIDEDGGVGVDTDATNPDEPVPAEAGSDMDAQSEGGVDVDAEISDGALTEADGEADADAALSDVAVDAAPIPCATDCKDSFPCTEDRCVNGECVHDPFTGTRECDNIACTQNDKCESGTCKTGTPNNGACPDDGNVCTSEVCDPTRGCNRQNAPSTTACVDTIMCTANDRCSNGVCRSGTTDTCTNGRICSAQGTCVATSCSTNCDDGDPCTDDECVSGSCRNTRRNGALNRCSDGKSCTRDDACGSTANSCVGVDTCPDGASCGGSLCECDDDNRTLCDDTSVNPAVQVCADTNSDPKFCGSCSRKCADGAGCQNSACKPAGASDCTAYRFGGHDYLVCRNGVNWTAARDQCRSWGLGLAIIDSADENTFLRDRSESQHHWIGANDRGNNGQGFQNDTRAACLKNAEEGTWYWVRPSSTGNNNNDDNFRKFCTMENANNTWSCRPEGGSAYQNWAAPQPDNAGCSNCGGCIFGFGCDNCNEGEDCGALLHEDGKWNDAVCNTNMGFICESP